MPCGCEHNRSQARMDSEPLPEVGGVPLMGAPLTHKLPNTLAQSKGTYAQMVGGKAPRINLGPPTARTLTSRPAGLPTIDVNQVKATAPRAGRWNPVEIFKTKGFSGVSKSGAVGAKPFSYTKGLSLKPVSNGVIAGTKATLKGISFTQGAGMALGAIALGESIYSTVKKFQEGDDEALFDVTNTGIALGLGYFNPILGLTAGLVLPFVQKLAVATAKGEQHYDNRRAGLNDDGTVDTRGKRDPNINEDRKEQLQTPEGRAEYRKQLEDQNQQDNTNYGSCQLVSAENLPSVLNGPQPGPSPNTGKGPVAPPVTQAPPPSGTTPTSGGEDRGERPDREGRR